MASFAPAASSTWIALSDVPTGSLKCRVSNAGETLRTLPWAGVLLAR